MQQEEKPLEPVILFVFHIFFLFAPRPALGQLKCGDGGDRPGRRERLIAGLPAPPSLPPARIRGC